MSSTLKIQVQNCKYQPESHKVYFLYRAIETEYIMLNKKIRELLKKTKVKSFIVNDHYGFHHSKLQEIEKDIKNELDKLSFQKPHYTIFSNFNSSILDIENVKRNLNSQIFNKINIFENIRTVLGKGCDLFVDVV